MTTIYIVTEDDIDYDQEDEPYLLGVNLLKAFDDKNNAESFIEQLDRNGLEIKVVELV